MWKLWKLKLEFEQEERRLACEAQKAWDAKKALQDAQLELKRIRIKSRKRQGTFTWHPSKKRTLILFILRKLLIV